MPTITERLKELREQNQASERNSPKFSGFPFVQSAIMSWATDGRIMKVFLLLQIISTLAWMISLAAPMIQKDTNVREKTLIRARPAATQTKV